MRSHGKSAYDGRGGELGTLSEVLIATGDKANIEELYRPLSAREAARFLGLSESQLRHMTSRREVPSVQLSANRVAYLPIDLIEWLRARRRPTRA
jgi:predicted DNA-binding transcriptional regulator AlpA